MNSKQPDVPGPYQLLLVERRDACVLVTLNRPEKLNALNNAIRTELSSALLQLEKDDSVQVVILTGAGRAFSAGMDLGEFGQPSDEAGRDSEGGHLNVYSIVENFPKPIIAAINGFAVTGGFEIVLSCDILLAAKSAKFADTHGLVGILPGAGLSQKLSRIIGMPRAMALSLTGEYISAQEAFNYGIVSHILDEDALLPKAWKMAKKIASMNPETIYKLKHLIKEGAKQNLGEGLALEKEFNATWMAQGHGEKVASRKTGVMERGRTQNKTE